MKESKRAIIFLKASSYLMDEVFTRAADLQSVFAVFEADTRYHSLHMELYLERYERSLRDSSSLSRVSK